MANLTTYTIGDGSWKLQILITDLQVERALRVKSDLHIGGVMLKLVEELDVAMDWSDHALWWPERNRWLTNTRLTLDQCQVQADALLHFTPMHKPLRVQLPDLRYLDCNVDFSVNTLKAVIYLCKELNISHPEELSFCKPLEANDLKFNMMEKKNRDSLPKNIPADTNTFVATSHNQEMGSNNSLNKSNFMCAPVSTPKRNTSTPINSPSWKSNNNTRLAGSITPNGSNIAPEMLEDSLASSPALISNEVRSQLLKPKSLVEKARLNVAWLDSSLSLMEQGVRDFDTLNLRFKFYSFYALDPRQDAARINQLYEQAKWQILNDELDCTEEEGLMFGALQLQITLQASVPQPCIDHVVLSGGDDDIDAALEELQVSLEGSHINSSNITQVPELSDYLGFFKPRRFTLKSFKRYWFTIRELRLKLYKRREDASRSSPVIDIDLRGCEVQPSVRVTQSIYVIHLQVPQMSEMYIRCDTEDQYTKWMAAFRLAERGRSLADSSYSSEVATIKSLLEMQRPAPVPAIDPSSLDINPENYLSTRFVKKLKGRSVQRLLEAHTNVKDLTLSEAKMRYLKAWQSLPDFGYSLFVIKFMGFKKEELLGVTHDRIIRMDINTGNHIKTWRFSSMKAWNVNWEAKHMMVQFDTENIIFACLSADCKVVHEFIGGYIFLSMRSRASSQTLNEELFHKLTDGWV